MGGLLAALGMGGTAAGATAAGTGLGISSLPAAMVGSAGTGALTGAATSVIPSVLSAGGGAAGGGMLANALKGINSLEQQPAVQLAQKLKPFMQSTPAPPLSPMGGGGNQVVQRKRTRMFE